MITIDRLAPDLQITGQRPACWGVDPETFYGPADSLAGRPLHVWERRALAVCAGCPVTAACLAEALEFPAANQYGVVGGMTAGQRRALLRTSRRGPVRAQRSRRRGQNSFRLLVASGVRCEARGQQPPPPPPPEAPSGALGPRGPELRRRADDHESRPDYCTYPNIR